MTMLFDMCSNQWLDESQPTRREQRPIHPATADLMLQVVQTGQHQPTRGRGTCIAGSLPPDIAELPVALIMSRYA